MTILKKVTHPCLNKCLAIVKPIDMNNFTDVYMVLEMCDMDMRKLLKSSKHLEEVQVKSIVYDILCGLKYLHKAQLIHRDIKPDNILLNDDCTVQICDFGLARSVKGIVESENANTQDTTENDEDTPKTQQNKDLDAYED